VSFHIADQDKRGYLLVSVLEREDTKSSRQRQLGQPRILFPVPPEDLSSSRHPIDLLISEASPFVSEIVKVGMCDLWLIRQAGSPCHRQPYNQGLREQHQVPSKKTSKATSTPWCSKSSMYFVGHKILMALSVRSNYENTVVA
jgi:hypothetical protein